jgi:hypothetical protein
MLRALKQVRSAFSMMNPEEVRDRATRPLQIALMARDTAGMERMEAFLVPAAAPAQMRSAGLRILHRAGDARAPRRFDLILCEEGVSCPHGGFTLRRSEPESTLVEILRAREDIGLALARNFLPFRKPAVDRIVHAVARENALFSIATALPNVVPSLLELPWAMGEFASDTFFLTVNQVRMAFLIAAACGHDVGIGQQKAEILTIAAGAFGWRAIARELAGKIPLGGGLIPKGAIAYAGTFVIGKGLEKLHYSGERHTREERRELYHGAYERGTDIARTVVEERSPV